VSGALVEDEAVLTAIARAMKTVAVVGIKDRNEPDAPAYSVSRLLADSGVRVIGVNPKIKQALGQPTIATLAELGEAPDIVDVFRRSDDRRPAVVWLQSGIRHDESAARLVAAGYRVVQDRCLGVYRRRVERGR